MKIAKLSLKKIWYSQFAVSDIVGVAFLASIIIGYLLLFINLHPRFKAASDFASFFTGARIIKEGKGQLLYDLETQFSYQQELTKPYVNSMLNRFVTLPLTAVLYIPFTNFSFFTAHKLFTFINFGVLLILIYFLFRSFKHTRKYFPLLTLLTLIFIPAFTTLLSSQLSYILSFIILFIYLALRGNKHFLSGVISGLLVIKVQYLILIPFLLLLSRKKGKYLFGVLTSFVLLTVVNILLVGVQPLLDYPSFMLNTEVPFYGNRAFQMFSLHAATSYLFFKSNLNDYLGLAINAIGYLIAYFVFLLRYKKIAFNSAYISAVILSVIFAAHVLSHDLMLLIVPIFILLNQEFKKKNATRVIIFIALLLYAAPVFVVTKTAFLGGFLLLAISLYFLFPKTFTEIRLY